MGMSMSPKHTLIRNLPFIEHGKELLLVFHSPAAFFFEGKGRGMRGCSSSCCFMQIMGVERRRAGVEVSPRTEWRRRNCDSRESCVAQIIIGIAGVARYGAQEKKRKKNRKRRPGGGE